MEIVLLHVGHRVPPPGRGSVSCLHMDSLHVRGAKVPGCIVGWAVAEGRVLGSLILGCRSWLSGHTARSIISKLYQMLELNLWEKRNSLILSQQCWPPCTGSKSILKFSLKFYSKFFESLKSIAPAYLPKLLHSNTPITALRSTDQLLLDIRGSRLKPEETEPFWWQPLLCGN